MASKELIGIGELDPYLDRAREIQAGFFMGPASPPTSGRRSVRHDARSSMRFALSEEHTALAATAARWAESNFGPARLRQRTAGEPADIADALAELARFGWLGIVVPEDHGGSGGTLLDGCLIAEQLARHLAPVPFAGDALVAATAMALLGQPGQRPVALSDLAEGSRVFSLVLDERLCWPPGVGERRAYEWVPGAWLLVPEGPELVATRQLNADPLPCEDLLRSVARVPAGTTGSAPAPDSAQRLLATAHVALAACLVGAMAGAMATALAHVASREQFGRTIGSFQAVQHLCADMLVDVESSRTATYGAAWAVDNRPPAGPRWWRRPRPRPGPPRPPAGSARPPSNSTGAWATPGSATSISICGPPSSWGRPSVESRAPSIRWPTGSSLRRRPQWSGVEWVPVATRGREG